MPNVGGLPKGTGQQAMNNLAHNMKDFGTASLQAGQAAKGTSQMTKDMNSSFQGMQAKAGVIQKIISTTMDLFAIGVSKTQKEFVGAMKKAFSEGDIAGAVDALVNMRYQFVDLSKLAAPWIQAFKPINDIFSAIAGFATRAIVGSTEFQEFIKDAFSPDGIDNMMRMGEKLGNIIMTLVDMDWETSLDIIDRIITKIGEFITFTNNFSTLARGVGSHLFTPVPGGGRLSDLLG
jgi:hypothetical protein